MENLTETLNSTHANIEKLIELLAYQSKQQQLIKRILQYQAEVDSNQENEPKTAPGELEKAFINAHHNFTTVLDLVCNSYHLAKEDMYNFSNSYHFQDNNKSISRDSYQEDVDDIKTFGNSYHSAKDGMQNIGDSNDDKMVGVANDFSSIPDKMVGVANQKLLQPESLGIDINRLDPIKYNAGLRVEMLKCNNDSVKNAGIILIQLYQNPKQSHKELMKLTGLSVDGMAKHIRMLKKRALVHKTGFQQYELTEKALDILRSAV